MKRKSLKTKVLLSFGAISFAMLVVFGFVFYYFYNQNMMETIKNRLYSQSYVIKEQLSRKKFETINDKYPFAITKNNQLIFKTSKYNLPDITILLDKKKTFFTMNVRDIDDVDEIEYEQAAIYILKFQEPFDGKIVIFKNEIDDEFENIISTILILEPILFLLFLLLANRMIDNILKPIKKINTVAKDISVHNFQNKIPLTNSEDEIQELIQTFNSMIVRLKGGVEKLDRFNSDVSHELKTPLTIINGKVELSLKKDRDKEYYKESLKTIQFESNKIQRIVNKLLQLTKYTKENVEQSFVLSDLNAILLETMDNFLPKAKAKKINLEVVRFEKTATKANQELISAIFSNLIDNAIKYTPAGKNINISLYTNKKIHFIIQDEGIGIPKDKLSKITDRFYRVDEARNKNIEGFGLGLSIIKNSVELLGGKLSIHSDINKGTTVEVVL